VGPTKVPKRLTSNSSCPAAKKATSPPSSERAVVGALVGIKLKSSTLFVPAKGCPLNGTGGLGSDFYGSASSLAKLRKPISTDIKRIHNVTTEDIEEFCDTVGHLLESFKGNSDVFINVDGTTSCPTTWTLPRF
jgi:hypothetical protein